MAIAQQQQQQQQPFNGLFQDNLGKQVPFFIGWQWHQVDHMQMICVSL